MQTTEPTISCPFLQRRWPFWIGLTAVAALLVSFVGGGEHLPLDGHEALVARSSEEMVQRQSLLAPYLNNQPRINKPPLSYWLVILADRLGPHPGRVSCLEARLPSALGGAALILITLAIGCVLLDRVRALLAAWLLLGCSGFTTYSHSARPEMLYAALSALGLLGLLLARRSALQGVSDGRSRWWAWAGWAALGLAALTKGPHLPLMLAAGLILGMCRLGEGRLVLRALRPFSGLALFVLLFVWWYVCLYLALPNAGTAWWEEIAERTQARHRSWWVWFNPFYLYRSAGLMLPWVALYPFALLLPWLGRPRQKRPGHLLWWILITVMITLSLFWGRRPYYMLPVLSVLALACADAALLLGREFCQAAQQKLLQGLLSAHVVGLVVAAVVLLLLAPVIIRPPLPALLGLSVVAALLLVMIWWSDRAAPGGAERCLGQGPAAGPTVDPTAMVCRGLLAMAAAAVCFFPAMTVHNSLWTVARFRNGEFARGVASRVPAQDTLISWGTDRPIIQYYAHRDLPVALRLEQLQAGVASGHGALWLVVRADHAPVWPATLTHQLIFSTPASVGQDPDDVEELWLVKRAATIPGGAAPATGGLPRTPAEGPPPASTAPRAMGLSPGHT